MGGGGGGGSGGKWHMPQQTLEYVRKPGFCRAVQHLFLDAIEGDGSAQLSADMLYPVRLLPPPAAAAAQRRKITTTLQCSSWVTFASKRTPDHLPRQARDTIKHNRNSRNQPSVLVYRRTNRCGSRPYAGRFRPCHVQTLSSSIDSLGRCPLRFMSRSQVSEGTAETKETHDVSSVAHLRTLKTTIRYLRCRVDRHDEVGCVRRCCERRGGRGVGGGGRARREEGGGGGEQLAAEEARGVGDATATAY
jgi:hypothetical protein